MTAPQFGPALRALRQEFNLSQAEFAAKLHSTQRHVSFLETGRAQPTRSMIQRIEREYHLPISRRLMLYDAAGMTSPYKRRDLASEEIVEALDIIERHVLGNWPFPGFVLDKRWSVLRMNPAARRFLQIPEDQRNAPFNLFELLISSAFRDQIVNWREAAPLLYTRLYSHAEDDTGLKALFERAVSEGLFDEVMQDDKKLGDVPVFVPVELKRPDGTRLRMSSLLGQLASVQDAIIEGMTIEMMVPLDEATERNLKESPNSEAG